MNYDDSYTVERRASGPRGQNYENDEAMEKAEKQLLHIYYEREGGHLKLSTMRDWQKKKKC